MNKSTQVNVPPPPMLVRSTAVTNIPKTPPKPKPKPNLKPKPKSTTN